MWWMLIPLAMSAAASIKAGQAASAAAGSEATQLALRRTDNEIAAAQDEAARREGLTSSLQTIQAIQASRGVSADSPTARAIVSKTISDAERGMATSRYSYLAEGENLRMAQSEAARRRSSSMLTGLLQGGGTFGVGLMSKPPAKG